MTTRPALIASWILALSAACTIGRPLVDELPKEPANFEGVCQQMVACEGSLYGHGNDEEEAAAVGELEWDIPEPCEPDAADDSACLWTADSEQLRGPGPDTIGDVHFALSAQDEQPIVLDGVDLFNVVITLEGPVRLEILGDSRLQKVVIEAIDPGARLSIRDAELSRVRLIGLDRVSIRRSTATVLGVEAGDVYLENVGLKNASATAEVWNFAGGRVTDSRLACEQCNLVSAHVERLALERCGALTVTNSRLENSMLAACTLEPSTLFDVMALQNAILGPLHVVDSIVRYSRLAHGASTSWASEFTGSILCEGSSLALDLGSSANCLHCDANAESVRESCYEGDNAEAPNHPCEHFRKLPQCEGKFAKPPESGNGTAAPSSVPPSP